MKAILVALGAGKKGLEREIMVDQIIKRHPKGKEKCFRGGLESCDPARGVVHPRKGFGKGAYTICNIRKM